MTSGTRSAWWRRARRVLPSVLIWTTLGLCVWWAWPTRFGGDTTTLVVEGHSMEPTYHSGDLIVAHADDHYRPGEIVVFRIKRPGDHAGDALIVHRLIAIDPDGHITTQGDNRSVSDGFGLTTANIVGRARLRVPSGGTILRVASRWWMLAVMTGLIVTMTLWPPSSGAIESADERKEHDVAPAAA